MSEDVTQSEGSTAPLDAAPNGDLATSSQSSPNHTRGDQSIQGEHPEASAVFNRIYNRLNFLLEEKETLMIHNVSDKDHKDYYRMWSYEASIAFRRLVIMRKRRVRPKDNTG